MTTKRLEMSEGDLKNIQRCDSSCSQPFGSFVGCNNTITSTYWGGYLPGGIWAKPVCHKCQYWTHCGLQKRLPLTAFTRVSRVIGVCIRARDDRQSSSGSCLKFFIHIYWKTCSVNSFIALLTENIDVKQLLIDPRLVRWFCAPLVCSKCGYSHQHPAGAPRSYSSTAESSPQETYTGNYTDLLIWDTFNTFSFNSGSSTNGLLLNPAQLFWIKPWSTLSERVVTAVMQVNTLQCRQLLSDCFLAAN